jgi:hypothetical protein
MMRMERLRPFDDVSLPSEGEQRSSARSPVAIGARCRSDSRTRDYVALVDLSEQGCCIFSRQPLLSPGQRVTLSPETLAGLYGRVQWSEDCLAGVLFDSPLYGPVYEHLARTFRRLPPEAWSAPPGGGIVRLSDEHCRELLKKIDEAEAKDRPQDMTEADRYNRMVRETPRSGLRSLRRSGQVMQLIHGPASG